MMGLLSVGLQSERHATDDTAFAAMSQYVQSTLQTHKFSDLSSAGFFFAFDADGHCLSSTNVTVHPAGSLYLCSTSFVTNAASLRTAGLSTNNVGIFRLTFVWPYPRNAMTNTMSVPVFNYD